MKGLHSFPEKQKMHNSILPTLRNCCENIMTEFFFMSTKYEEICLTRSKKKKISLDFQKQFLEAGGEDDYKLAPK